MVEINIKVGDRSKKGILTKITEFIFGIFACSVIFAFFVRVWAETGVVFGFATTILLTGLTFYKSKPNSFPRRAAYGMAFTVIAVTIAWFTIMQILETSFEGFVGS